MTRSVTIAGATALALALVASSAVMAQDGEPADPVTSANGEVSDTLIAEDGSLAVYQKHIEVLNACDWVGLMAQYPNEVELHLGGGNVTVGREAIGAVPRGPLRTDLHRSLARRSRRHPGRQLVGRRRIPGRAVPGLRCLLEQRQVPRRLREHVWWRCWPRVHRGGPG